MSEEDVPFAEEPTDEEISAAEEQKARHHEAFETKATRHYPMNPTTERPTNKRDKRRAKREANKLALRMDSGGFIFMYPGIRGQVIWSEDQYWESDHVLTRRILDRFRKEDIRGCCSERGKQFVYEKLLAYPMYEGNWGKAGTDINTLTLRREVTYRQCYCWVFDDKTRGLAGQPFVYCPTGWTPEIDILLHLYSNGENREYGDKASELMSDETNLIDYSGIADVLAGSGTKANAVDLTFSSHTFPGSQVVIERKLNKKGLFTRYFYRAKSGKEWNFDISLFMFYKRFPRRLYIKVAAQ